MKTTTPVVERSGARDQNVAAASASVAGRSWMVWLRAQPHAAPDPTRAGLDSTQQALALGRCLLVLPDDGEPHSWHCGGGRTALFYGHLLNREELCQRLELPTSAAPPTDAELLMAAYGVWGCDAAQELEGPYVAVVWDEVNETLFCARDPIGVMPVFYARAGADLVVSTDIWTLLRHPEVPREVNRLVLAEFMLDTYAQAEETFFTRVRRLPGAHYLRARGGDFSVVRYWDPLPPGQPIEWRESAEPDGFSELMHRTVASHLELGPAAISLSSGIDSVSVAAFATEVAARYGHPLPHGLSVHFADPACDESVGQRAVADALEMPFCLLSFEDCLGRRPLLEATIELAPRYPSPLINMWEPLYCHMAEVARSRGIRVILTGTGGDEWLGVTPLLAADLIRAGDWGGLWRLYRTQLRSYPVSPLPFGRNILWQFGLREVLRDAAYRHVPGWVARRRRPVELPQWIAPDPELRRPLLERLQPPAPRPSQDSTYVRELRPALQHAVVAMELEEFHYRGRGRGVSYYHPYWTRPVVEFLLRTPPARLNEGGLSKSMARRLLAERLPSLDFQQQKKFTVTQFYHRMIEQQQPALWGRWAADSALARAGVVDARLLGTAMRAAATGQTGHAGDAASWLSAEAWLRGQG